MNLLDPLFRWDAVQELFSDRARIESMLHFESALARAEARVGVIPSPAAGVISAKCRVDLFDINALAKSAAKAGNLAIPLVKQLTTLTAADDKQAAHFVHWGATSQDVIDTGFVLQLRKALELLESELGRLCRSVAGHVQNHRAATMAGRTWLQQAVPTTFGLKAAGWLDALSRSRVRLVALHQQAIPLQFGGAVGTLAALGDKGMAVTKALGEELRLALPDLPWHTQRDRMAEVAATLGILTGTLGKIARDISLEAQTEVAELFEPAGQGRGVSSTMPQKRNPVAAAVVLAAAQRMPGLVSTILSAMVQEQERGLGGWHAEWETIPEIVELSAGALHHLADSVEGLDVRTDRMRENLDATRGLIFAEAVQMTLANTIGLAEAHEVVAEASKRALSEGRHLRDVLASDSRINAEIPARELERLFDPDAYFGVANQFIDRVTTRHAAIESRARERKA